jgi:hypothetical protein
MSDKLTRLFNQFAEDTMKQVRENGATPSGIEVALWHYCRCEPHLRLHAGAVIEAIDDMIELGMLEKAPFDPQGTGYHMTEKGKAWIELLCATPMPKRIWIDPRKASTYERI